MTTARDDMRQLLLGLAERGEELRLILAPIGADSVPRVAGVPIAARATTEAEPNLAPGKVAVIIRTGAAQSAHLIIGTL